MADGSLKSLHGVFMCCGSRKGAGGGVMHWVIKQLSDDSKVSRVDTLEILNALHLISPGLMLHPHTCLQRTLLVRVGLAAETMTQIPTNPSATAGTAV